MSCMVWIHSPSVLMRSLRILRTWCLSMRLWVTRPPIWGAALTMRKGTRLAGMKCSLACGVGSHYRPCIRCETKKERQRPCCDSFYGTSVVGLADKMRQREQVVCPDEHVSCDHGDVEHN